MKWIKNVSIHQIIILFIIKFSFTIQFSILNCILIYCKYNYYLYYKFIYIPKMDSQNSIDQ